MRSLEGKSRHTGVSGASSVGEVWATFVEEMGRSLSYSDSGRAPWSTAPTAGVRAAVGAVLQGAGEWGSGSFHICWKEREGKGSGFEE